MYLIDTVSTYVDGVAYSDETCTLNGSYIGKRTFSLSHMVEYLTILSNNTALGILPCSRELFTINLPLEDLEVCTCM